MFFDCVILMFLVLLQLPKKEAGAGMAFGGSATDALFGAGSGNALTSLTQWTAGIFFFLALCMALMTAHRDKNGTNGLIDALTKGGAATGKLVSQPASATPSSGGGNLLTAPPTTSAVTNSSAAPATSPGTSTPATAPSPSLETGTNK